MRRFVTGIVLCVGMLQIVSACGASDDGPKGSSGAAGGGATGGASAAGGATATGGGSGNGGTSGGSGGSGGASGSGGTSGGSGGSGASGSGGTSGGSSGSAGRAGSGSAGSPDAGSATDARASDVRDAADAAVDRITDTGSQADVPPTNPDAGAPYKGVANSPCDQLATLGSTWFYNWTLSAGSCKTPEFVPMLWGHTGNEQTATGITNALNSAVSAGYKTMLGFNEPDNSGQSNMTVAAAIALWPSFNNPSLRIGSPATSANAAGQTWFKDFMAQVNADTTGTLRVDFIAAHWYGWNAGSCEANASSLESYIKTIEAIPGNRPIWLTEWGCMNLSNPDAATVQAFFTGALAMFKKHPRIERYAWYPWNTNNELFISNAITPLGNLLAAAPAGK